MISEEDKRDVLIHMKKSLKRVPMRFPNWKKIVYYEDIESRLKTALKNAGK